MIHNFEAWRKSMQERTTGASLSHFHKCSDENYRVVRKFLNAIINNPLAQNSKYFSCRVSTEALQIFADFINEMEFSYMHPRSDSAKIHFVHLMKKTQSTCQPST